MHDIWNPWHGCQKVSEGCKNCYMFYLDGTRGVADSSVVTRTNNFYYPLAKNRNGSYKVKSGEMLRVCMTSDFFVEGADGWRDEAWNVVYGRRDVKFYLLTKRPERVKNCLPRDWGDGWENVFFNVTCENQRRADERIPLLLDLPFKHKGIMCAPFIGEVSIAKYLASGQIERVTCDGENYNGCRPCHYEWAKKLYDECVAADVAFAFLGTGNRYVKNGVTYDVEMSRQSRLAFSENLYHKGKPMNFVLTDNFGLPIPEDELYVPHFRPRCDACGMKFTCNGCSDCGKCDERYTALK